MKKQKIKKKEFTIEDKIKKIERVFGKDKEPDPQKWHEFINKKEYACLKRLLNA